MLSNETRLSPPIAREREGVFIFLRENARQYFSLSLSLSARKVFLPIKLIVRSGQRIILPSRVRFRDNGATPVTAREEMKKGVSGDEVRLHGRGGGRGVTGVERSRDGES